MPVTFSGRSVNTGNLSPMIPIVANNPAFKVRIVPVDGRMEQKPNALPDRDQQEAINIGDYISGEEVSKTRKNGRAAAGKVVQVLKNNENIYAYKILDADGKEVLIDPTTAAKEEAEKPVGANESYVLSYESWLSESRKTL
jgi:hypothetical protein